MKKVLLFLCLLFIFLITGCNKKEYTVKFVGPNNEIIYEITVTSKDKIEYPNDPVIEGYNFLTWEKKVEYAEENIVIKGLFEKTTYIVNIYDINGFVIKSIDVYHGDTINVADVNMNIEGYTFLGFDKDYSSIKSNLDLHPIYDKISYKVIFLDNDGDILQEQKVYHGDSVTSPDPQEVEGKKFVGWDKSLNSVTGDMTVRPIYEAICYEVSFVDYYGNLLYSSCVSHGSSAVAPDAPVVEYHTFSKWDQDYSFVTSAMVIRPIYTKNTSYDIRTSDYWLSILSGKYNINETLLASSEITEFNSKVFSNYSLTKVVDLNNMYKKEYGTNVNSMINSYTKINKYTLYNKDTFSRLSTGEINEILDNRNLDNIPNIVEIKFGIVCDFAHLRAYPTNHYSDSFSMDRFQETTFNVGEGVAIYHESKDGLWYFVQGANYNGWILKEYVGLCSYDEMKEFLNPTTKLVVISDYVTLLDKHTRMGQAFPLVDSNETTYWINFPRVDSSGKLELVELAVGKSDDYNVGYLDYTYKNVFIQAFKLLGIDYSWGDKLTSGRDCSSTMNAIYTCFGFVMPRNTSNQNVIPDFGKKVSGLTVSSLKTYKPGTMIFTSSHVMLYIGENLNGEPYLLHNTTSNGGGCILQSFESYGGSKMIAVLNMQ